MGISAKPALKMLRSADKGSSVLATELLVAARLAGVEETLRTEQRLWRSGSPRPGLKAISIMPPKSLSLGRRNEIGSSAIWHDAIPLGPTARPKLTGGETRLAGRRQKYPSRKLTGPQHSLMLDDRRSISGHVDFSAPTRPSNLQIAFGISGLWESDAPVPGVPALFIS